MALTIPEVVRRFKANVAAALSAETILRICTLVGHTWRERVLGPVATVHVFLLQVLHGNTACTAMPHLSGILFSAAAYCVARARLPLILFEQLLRHVSTSLADEIDDTGRWRGHRT